MPLSSLYILICLWLALTLPREFLQQPLTVLTIQTRQSVHAINQSTFSMCKFPLVEQLTDKPELKGSNPGWMKIAKKVLFCPPASRRLKSSFPSWRTGIIGNQSFPEPVLQNLLNSLSSARRNKLVRLSATNFSAPVYVWMVRLNHRKRFLALDLLSNSRLGLKCLRGTTALAYHSTV